MEKAFKSKQLCDEPDEGDRVGTQEPGRAQASLVR